MLRRAWIAVSQPAQTWVTTPPNQRLIHGRQLLNDVRLRMVFSVIRLDM